MRNSENDKSISTQPQSECFSPTGVGRGVLLERCSQSNSQACTSDCSGCSCPPPRQITPADPTVPNKAWTPTATAIKIWRTLSMDFNYTTFWSTSLEESRFLRISDSSAESVGGHGARKIRNLWIRQGLDRFQHRKTEFLSEPRSHHADQFIRGPAVLFLLRAELDQDQFS